LIAIGLPPKPASRKLFTKSFLENLSKILKRGCDAFHHSPFGLVFSKKF
jgi:predicted methyltransferase